MSQPPSPPCCRQTSSFVFKSALIFLLLANCRDNTHTHTLSGELQAGRREEACFTFYFTVLRLLIFSLDKKSSKLSSYKQSANYSKSTYCTKYKIYTRIHNILRVESQEAKPTQLKTSPVHLMLNRHSGQLCQRLLYSAVTFLDIFLAQFGQIVQICGVFQFILQVSH